MRLVATLLLLCAFSATLRAAEGDVEFGRATVGEMHPDVRLPEEGRAALRGDIVVPARDGADEPVKLLRLPFELLL